MRTDETSLGGLQVFAAAAGFGTLAIFGKLAASTGLDTPTLLLFRFVVATVALWTVFGLLGRAQLLSGRQLRVALAMGTVYGLMTVLFFEGLVFLPAGLAAVVFYTYPVFVFGISTAALDERVTRPKLLALVVAVAGVGLLVGASPARADPVGVVLVLSAAIGYATYTTGSRAALDTVDPAPLAATALVAAMASVIPYGMVTGGLSFPSGLDQWLLVVGIALVGTAAPVVLFVGGLERIEASQASVIGTSEPAVTVLLGVAVLGEPVTPVLVVGGGLVLCAVLLVQREGRPTAMVVH